MRDRYYDRKKKVLVVCLVGARSLLRLEKKSSSRLSGGCAIITVGFSLNRDSVAMVQYNLLRRNILTLNKKQKMKIMGRVARLILLVVVSVCVVFCVLCCRQTNPVFSSVNTILYFKK